MRTRDHSKMKNEIAKKSLEKSKNVLEETRKKGQAKNLHHNTNIIATNIVSSKQFCLIEYIETSKAQGSKRSTKSLDSFQALSLYFVFED